jgi:hypothetical protein
MVLRPPIARGLRFSQGADAGQNMAKAVIEPTKFAAIKWASGVRRHRPLLPKQQIPMPLRQRSERSREGTSAAAPRRIARVAARCGSAALRSQLSSVPPVAAVDSPAAIRARPDADLGFLADRADPERGHLLVTNGAALCARHVQAPQKTSSNRFRRCPADLSAQAPPRAGRSAPLPPLDRAARSLDLLSPGSHAPTRQLPAGS